MDIVNISHSNSIILIFKQFQNLFLLNSFSFAQIYAPN